MSSDFAEIARYALCACLQGGGGVTCAFFCDVFEVVCVTSKLAQRKSDLRINVVRGMVKVLCTQLISMQTHVVPGGWEDQLAFDPQSSPVRGSRLHFLRALVADLEKRFSEGEWVQAEGVEEWVEASSCSCERVFSYVTCYVTCLTPVEPVATPPMQPEPVRVSTYLNFQYGVDSAVRKAIAQRTIHEWTVQELRSICRGHALNVRGCKSDLLQRVIAHFGKK